jgi:hypothetical protein
MLVFAVVEGVVGTRSLSNIDVTRVGWGSRTDKKKEEIFKTMTLRDDTAEGTAENLLKRLSDIEHYPDEALAPYKEFTIGGKTYYFTPGGFLYRKDPGAEEIGGFFCGYLSDEVWHYRADGR